MSGTERQNSDPESAENKRQEYRKGLASRLSKNPQGEHAIADLLELRSVLGRIADSRRRHPQYNAAHRLASDFATSHDQEQTPAGQAQVLSPKADRHLSKLRDRQRSTV